MLLLGATALFAFGPQIRAWASRSTHPDAPASTTKATLGMLAVAVYGGYFTAAQGVLYLGILGVFTGRPMGSVNSVKNLLSLCVNLAAALIYSIAFFVVDAQVVWAASAAVSVACTTVL